MACTPASFARTANFWSRPTGQTASSPSIEVKYTFGVDPLQQYLVEFPDGRIQALSIAWDSRPQDKGGQRWFHIYPNEEIKHDDILHWTKLNQNWNFMCAECHSTGVRKNYDAKADRFATSWAEISVGCEACHGQGSRHAAWAREQQSWWPFGKREDPSKGLLALLDERRGVTWPIDPQTGIGRRSVAPATLRKEVETCGLCHARRAGFHEDWMPGQWLSQTHVVEPLARNTYHPDGQIRDVEEPYNYAPFKQGKMFAAGVTCSDCHEPHSAKLRAPGEGVCLQCHAPDKYADVKHRHHGSAEPQPTCISCHMQTRTYMVVDPRHDHTFRVPRPDLSLTLGTPNACNDCHRDKPAEWAATAVEQWFGPNRKGFQTFGAAFHAARTDQADAAALLGVIAADRNVPAVARASALSELAPRVSAREYRCRTTRAFRSRSDGTDRRARHAGEPAGRPDLAVGISASGRSGARRPDQGSLAARSRPGRKPTPGGSRALRSGGSRIHCRAACQRREAGSADHAGELPCAARTGGRGRSRIQGGVAAQPAIHDRRRQSRRPLSATWQGQRR